MVVNTFNYTDWLSMEPLRILKNKLEVAQFFNTSYNKEFTREFAVGETVRVPLPQRFTIRDGLGYQPQAINRQYTTVNCNQVFGVDFEMDSVETALKTERGREAFRKAYMEPAMTQIAQEIDSRCAQWAYLNANNIVGVLGTDPTSFQTFSSAARQRMIELACPPGDERGAIIPPQVNTSLKAAAITYMNPSSDISRQYRQGSIGKADGFDWYESMSLYNHTAGTWAGAVTVTTANQSGTTLNVTCTTGDTFNQGDVFGIGSVYAVNASTRRQTTTGTTKQFVVQVDVVGAASAAALTILPGIVGPGSQYQNVDALPTAGAALTLFPGTTSPNGKSGKQSLFISPYAFALVGVALETPTSAELASQTRDPDSGISVRFVKSWDPIQSRMTHRYDTLLGFGNLYSDQGVVRGLSA